MKTKKIAKSIVLITSITLVGIFVAYRSGYFNRNKKQIQMPTTFLNSNSDTLISNLYLNERKNDSTKNDKPIVVSYEPIDFEFIKINFDKILEKARLLNDTIDVDLADSLFLINDTTLFIKDKLVNRADFENYIHNNLISAYYNQTITRMSSSKSMPVFYQGEKFVNFKNLKFKYDQTISENYLLNLNLFKSKIDKIWPTKELNGFSLTSIEANKNILNDSFKLKINKIMLSSKSGYIISNGDFKKDTLKNMMGSSKSRVVFSKEDVKKDTLTSIHNDSIKN
jgi:hypothetical protein